MIGHASCACGQLNVACQGEPVRISMCHCFDCQKRTGSTFGAQVRFPRECVTITGQASQFTRTADSGNTVTLNFCPTCGSTVYWQVSSQPNLVAVAVGAFADPLFPAPRFSVYERRRHPWVSVPAGAEHSD